MKNRNNPKPKPDPEKINPEPIKPDHHPQEPNPSRPDHNPDPTPIKETNSPPVGEKSDNKLRSPGFEDQFIII